MYSTTFQDYQGYNPVRTDEPGREKVQSLTKLVKVPTLSNFGFAEGGGNPSYPVAFEFLTDSESNYRKCRAGFPVV